MKERKGIANEESVVTLDSNGHQVTDEQPTDHSDLCEINRLFCEQ